MQFNIKQRKRRSNKNEKKIISLIKNIQLDILQKIQLKKLHLGKSLGRWSVVLKFDFDFWRKMLPSGRLSTIISFKDSPARISYTIDSICHAPKVEATSSA